MKFTNKKLFAAFILGLSFSYGNAIANEDLNEAFNFWDNDGWNEFSYLTNTNNLNSAGTPDGVIDPGSGGQAFDTEYMFYKYDANTNNLSIGIQTGFDIETGHVEWSGGDYYAGDLALSFDGATLGDNSEVAYGNSYEYAVDFGLFTKNASGETVESMDSNGNLNNGIDPAGLYRVGKWDNDISYGASSPFAMDWSDDEQYAVMGLNDNYAGSGMVDQTGNGHNGQNLSYYRIVSFNLDSIIDEGETFTVDSHWAMSCGNDNINGQIELTRNTSGGNPVPEPSILALFCIGSLSIWFMGYRRRKLIV